MNKQAEHQEENMSDQETIDRNVPRHSFRSHFGDGPGWWEHRSLPWKILIGIGFGILGILFLGLLGFVVMALWNWLMPEIFGLGPVDYWQAWGLLVLSTILFKNFGSDNSDSRKSRKRRRHLRNYMQESNPDDAVQSPQS